MGMLKDNYTSFLKDIEENMKNKEDLEYVKKRFADFLDIVIDQMDNIMYYKKEQIEELENKQKELEERMSKMESIVNNIEKDIYSEEGCDFEIVCPYCNYEFVIDMDDEKTEVECPECHNIIELDWSGDPEDDHIEGCNGGCSSCHGCGPVDDLEDDDEENPDEFEDDM